MVKLKPNELSVKITGVESMDIDTLAYILHDLKNVYAEANRGSSQYIDLNVQVKPFKKGSFEIITWLLSNPETSKAIFDATPQAVSLVVDCAKSIFQMTGFLKGEKPSKVEKIDDSIMKVTNKQGKVETFNQTIYNIYLQGDSSVQKILETVSDKKFRGIEVTDGKSSKPILKSNRQQITKSVKNYKKLKSSRKKVKQDEIIVDENSIIQLKELDVSGESHKWTGTYKSKKISMNLKDESFLAKVNAGKHTFANGCILKGVLKIIKKVNTKTGDYLEPTYQMIKVKELKKPDKQTKIPFKEKN